MSDLKVKFMQSKFLLESNKIALSKYGGIPLEVCGPGEIRQDEEGVLQYKFFVGEDQYGALVKHDFREHIAGRLIPSEDHFELRVSDGVQLEWVSSQVLMETRGIFSKGVVFGNLQEIVKKTDRLGSSNMDCVIIQLCGKIKFPSNCSTEIKKQIAGHEAGSSWSLNVAQHQFNGFKFEMRHEDEHTVVSLSLPKGQLKPTTPMRIQEALQFVLGQRLQVMIIDTYANKTHTTRLISPRNNSEKIEPPLHFSNVHEAKNVWNMFANYFGYIHSYEKMRWHPVSCHIGSVLEASSASMEIQVLTLSVAVEGVLKECFTDICPISKELVSNVNKLLDLLKNEGFSESFKQRANGSLNAMKNPRGSDRVKKFVEKYNMPKELFDSWRMLRNSSAHGSLNSEIEKLIIQQQKTLSLFYAIIFSAIGYEGNRTNYAIEGWPKTIWPSKNSKK